jgi:pre-mRNA-splicing factor CWC26
MSRTKRSDALDKYSSKGGKSRNKSDVKIIDDDDDIPYEPEIDEAVDEGPIVVTENYITLGTCDDNVNDRNGGDFHEQKQKKKDSKRRRKRYDSDDSLSQRDLKRDRKRFDSDDEDQRQASRKTSRRRYDSDDDDIRLDRSKSHQKARKRYDSDDDMDHRSRKQHGAENEREESFQGRERDGDGAKMSSGHSAGLQSVAQFRITENKIQGQKRQDTKELTPGSTVYRDKDGKVLTVSDSAQNPKNNIENDGTWNVGTKQRQDALDRAAEMQSISQSTFSRSASDTDRFMRHVAREGDPMASHASKSDRGGKKIYKGPPPKPNRFNIRPGYRWDGVDRGNGFEDKVLAKIYGKGNRDEEHYKYSCADM